MVARPVRVAKPATVARPVSRTYRPAYGYRGFYRPAYGYRGWYYRPGIWSYPGYWRPGYPVYYPYPEPIYYPVPSPVVDPPAADDDVDVPEESLLGNDNPG